MPPWPRTIIPPGFTPLIPGERHRLVRLALTGALQDVYTVPTGKRALIGAMIIQNPTGGAVTPNVHLVPPAGAAGADNLAWAGNAALAAGAETFVNGTAGLEAGGKIRALGNGLVIHAAVTEFDVITPRAIGFAFLGNVPAADTLFYQCPAGKTARSLAFGAGFLGYANNAAPGLLQTKSDRAGAKLLMEDGTPGANAAITSTVLGGMLVATLEATDAIYLASASINTNVWAVFGEFPVP